MKKPAWPLCILILLSSSACSVHKIDSDASPALTAPDNYSPGEINVANNIEDKANDNRSDETSGIDHGKDHDSVHKQAWWQDLDRAPLTSLIEQSFEANQNIAQALARIEQAAALQRSTRSERGPGLNLEAGASETHRGSNNRRSSYEAGAALYWELDVFNRIGANAKADQLLTRARIEDYHALRLSLSAEVANAYFGAAAANNILQLLQQQLDTDKALLDLVKLRMESGVGTNVEVLQQASRVAESESLIPSAQAQIRIFENRLAVLLGQAPDGQNRVAASETLSFILQVPAVGVPADLLLQRPDLRARQAELVAADAGIASAIAERLPQLTLDGRYLYSDTGTSSGPLAIISGSFIMPLLDWGNRRAQVTRNKAIYTEKLATFTQSYLLAIEEVENALYQERKQKEYVALLIARRDLLQKTLAETEARYTQGVDDYLPVLNALQELRSVERDLVTEELMLIRFRIGLYRALGGSTVNSHNNSPDSEVL